MQKKNNTVVKQRKILILGGTGFIGYHLAKYASLKNFNVTSVSKSIPQKNRRLKKVNYIFFNIANKKKIKKIKINFDYVINASGYGEHHRFDKEGFDLFNNNFKSLVNLVEYFKNKKIKKFIHFGSSFEYSQSQAKIKENYKTKPNSIYGMSKLACTNYLLKNFRENNFPITIFRLFQVYGNQQNENRLIPYVVKSCLNNKKFKLTSGNQVRNFCHIDDVVRGVFLSLSNKKTNGEIFNIASDENFKIKKLVLIINKKIKRGKPLFGKKKLNIGEKNKIIPDIKKIYKFLKWKPKLTFVKGLNEILKYEKI
mgnify:CR=1 FL=1